MNLYIAPCNIDSPGFESLVRHLDAEMHALYPGESNHLDSISELARSDAYVIGAFDQFQQVACGAFKRQTDDGVYGEIKRVFVEPAYRGRGISKRILAALEDELQRRGILVARLETGIAGPEALALHERAGYRRHGPFGRYRDDPNSVFFEKNLDLVC